jgi:hypothetical protein
MQKIEQKHPKEINSNLKLFNESIRSEYTRKVYTVYLNKFSEFVGSNYIIECDSSTDPKEIEQYVIDFVIFLKKEGKGFSGIKNYISAICKYYKINDIVLNTNKIHQFLPEFRKSFFVRC